MRHIEKSIFLKVVPLQPNFGGARAYALLPDADKDVPTSDI